MQKNITLLQAQNPEPLFDPHRTIPVRRLVLRGDRNYLRALRAAEMDAWKNNILLDRSRVPAVEQNPRSLLPQPTR